MFENITTKLSEKKSTIRRRALIAGGAVLGLLTIGGAYKLGVSHKVVEELTEAIEK